MLLYLCRCQTYHIPDPEYLCVPKREALSVSYPLMKTIPILDSASHTPPFLPKFFLCDLRNHTPSSTKFLLPPTSLLTILQLSSPKKPGFPQKHTASSAALKSGGCLVRSFLSHYHFHRSQFSALWDPGYSSHYVILSTPAVIDWLPGHAFYLLKTWAMEPQCSFSFLNLPTIWCIWYVHDFSVPWRHVWLPSLCFYHPIP